MEENSHLILKRSAMKDSLFSFSEAEFSAAEDQLLIKIKNYISFKILLSLEARNYQLKCIGDGAFIQYLGSRYAPRRAAVIFLLFSRQCYHGMAHGS